MKRIRRGLLIGLFCLLLLAGLAMAHCEIPCGIYGDEMRIQMILENITTIEKSMNQITAIEQKKPHDANQSIRWVVNKEKHANNLQEIVSQYFLTQRIKPGADNYAAMLANLHEMLIFSMKCKQTTDLANANKLRALVTEFEKLYFGKAKDI